MIRVLPAEVVNQIAAGEVVERPFSVVKELVENSLDAGAQRIRVELSEGGRALIRVTDDGQGFGRDDLGLAFHSHATSKLGGLADLDHIASLGFRGEALASIGSIARATIRSRVPGADSGWEVGCAGGALDAVRPCGCPEGSAVEVRDLFFNTPARRRFLKTPRAERARIQDLIARLALARLDVDFTLIADSREVLRLPAGEDLRDRVRRAFGAGVAEQLIEVRREWGGGEHAVHGLAGQPDLARRDTTLELLFVNGRCAKDRGAGHAIRQAYREHLMGGRFPVYCLMLSLPPDRVDVNVHPTKSEVRFLDARRIGGLLYEAIRDALARRVDAAAGADAAGALSVGESRPRAVSGFPRLDRDLFGRGVAAAPSGGTTADRPALQREPHPFADVERRRFLQVLELYLVFESDDGMVVVDQHALHERVLYERFERQHAAAAGDVPVQRLLVPEVVELGAGDKEWLLEAAPVLQEQGFLIDDFGGNAVAVHGIPALLDRADPKKLLESLLDGTADDDARPRARDAIVARFHSRACRSAVMSGDALTDEEIRALLAEARALRHPHNCPHGRPTVLRFSAAELERFFRRRV